MIKVFPNDVLMAVTMAMAPVMGVVVIMVAAKL